MRFRCLKRSTLLLISLVAAGAGIFAVFLRPEDPIVRLSPPSSYPKGSELYYLAWVEHGSFGQRGGAALKLLSLPNRREVEVTRSLWRKQKRWDDFLGARQDQVIDHMLLIALFDLRPAEYRPALVRLVRRDPQRAEDMWVKTDDMFEGEPMDFRFDPAQEAAFRLIRHGYADRASIRILRSTAMSFYPKDRQRAAALLRLFRGLPAFDPTPQPRTINDVPAKTQSQVTAIEKWFDKHQNELRWLPQEQRYTLITP